MKFSTFNSKSFLILSLFSITFFVSCNETEKKVETSIESTQAPTLDQKKQALESVAPTQTTTTNGAMAINPAHGQPGHSCAVPVGAPLNGSGTSTSKPMGSQDIKLNTTNSTPVNTSGSGTITMNPAHGQPGHRCDIKVGAPL